jgi:HSP20 family molecular chaperone IbpA
MDIGSIIDEIFEAAREIGIDMQNTFGHGPERPEGPRGPWFQWHWDENTDYYPGYQYPPMNIFMQPDKTLVFEFALAGFEEKDLSLSFQGDYMIFSATINPDKSNETGARYFKRRLKLKDIEKQKYYAPADKFEQTQVKAVFSNGILRVSIPPKEETETPEGIKISIVKEGE